MEEAISWFKNAQGYKRLEFMVSLLNICIPFEIRYFGTYIEELGKPHYDELRSIEIHANDIDQLTKELSYSQGIFHEPSRQRLLVLISLMYPNSTSCANWIYNALLCHDNIETFAAAPQFSQHTILVRELLLLYTLASNHPVFNFNQKQYFQDIIAKLNNNKFQKDMDDTAASTISKANSSLSSGTESFVHKPMCLYPPSNYRLPLHEFSFPSSTLPSSVYQQTLPVSSSPSAFKLDDSPKKMQPSETVSSTITHYNTTENATALSPSISDLPPVQIDFNRLPPSPFVYSPSFYNNIYFPPYPFPTGYQEASASSAGTELQDSSTQMMVTPQVNVDNELQATESVELCEVNCSEDDNGEQEQSINTKLEGELQTLKLNDDVRNHVSVCTQTNNHVGYYSDCEVCKFQLGQTSTFSVPLSTGKEFSSMYPSNLMPLMSNNLCYKMSPANYNPVFYTPSTFPYQECTDQSCSANPCSTSMKCTGPSQSVPRKKKSCYNCGRTGHLGSECRLPTIDDVTQKERYRLRYDGSRKPPPL